MAGIAPRTGALHFGASFWDWYTGQTAWVPLEKCDADTAGAGFPLPRGFPSPSPPAERILLCSEVWSGGSLQWQAPLSPS